MHDQHYNIIDHQWGLFVQAHWIDAVVIVIFCVWLWSWPCQDVIVFIMVFPNGADGADRKNGEDDI